MKWWVKYRQKSIFSTSCTLSSLPNKIFKYFELWNIHLGSRNRLGFVCHMCWVVTRKILCSVFPFWILEFLSSCPGSKKLKWLSIWPYLEIWSRKGFHWSKPSEEAVWGGDLAHWQKAYQAYYPQNYSDFNLSRFCNSGYWVQRSPREKPRTATGDDSPCLRWSSSHSVVVRVSLGNGIAVMRNNISVFPTK